MYPAITAGISIIQGAQTLLGGGGSAPGDLEKNQAAYNLAVAGDKNALQYLHARSIQGPSAYSNVPGYGTIHGYATERARNDAGAKYQQAVQVLDALGVAEDTVQTGLNAAGYSLVPATRAEMAKWALFAVAALLVGYFAYRALRR